MLCIAAATRGLHSAANSAARVARPAAVVAPWVVPSPPLDPGRSHFAGFVSPRFGVMTTDNLTHLGGSLRAGRTLTSLGALGDLYAGADLGVAGRDTLLERRFDLYTPVDLGIGRCRLVVAAPEGAVVPDVPRVATKYPRVAAEHFAKRGVQAEIIQVSGSVEIAPILGLSHLIVDVVETGATLRENKLAVLETVAEVSTVLIANRAAYKLRAGEIRPLVARLRAALG